MSRTAGVASLRCGPGRPRPVVRPELRPELRLELGWRRGSAVAILTRLHFIVLPCPGALHEVGAWRTGDGGCRCRPVRGRLRGAGALRCPRAASSRATTRSTTCRSPATTSGWGGAGPRCAATSRGSATRTTAIPSYKLVLQAFAHDAPGFYADAKLVTLGIGACSDGGLAACWRGASSRRRRAWPPSRCSALLPDAGRDRERRAGGRACSRRCCWRA